MKIRILSSYPLIVDDAGRPILPPNVVDVPDAIAESVIAAKDAEPASDDEITAAATVIGLDAEETEAEAEQDADPVDSASEPEEKPARKGK